MIAAASDLVALHAAATLARHFDVDSLDILDVLSGAPVCMASLLADPRGWSALGEVVRDELGGQGAMFMPTIH